MDISHKSPTAVERQEGQRVAVYRPLNTPRRQCLFTVFSQETRGGYGVHIF